MTEMKDGLPLLAFFDVEAFDRWLARQPRARRRVA